VRAFNPPIREDPAPKASGPVAGTGGRTDWYPIFKHLHNHPNEWFLITSSLYHSGRYFSDKKHFRIPGGRYQCMSKVYRPDGTRGRFIYARFLSADQPVMRGEFTV
jgi:hypothetical protein